MDLESLWKEFYGYGPGLNWNLNILKNGCAKYCPKMVQAWIGGPPQYPSNGWNSSQVQNLTPKSSQCHHVNHIQMAVHRGGGWTSCAVAHRRRVSKTTCSEIGAAACVMYVGSWQRIQVRCLFILFPVFVKKSSRYVFVSPGKTIALAGRTTWSGHTMLVL